MLDVEEGVTPESPAGSEASYPQSQVSPDPSSAGTQNTEQQPGQPFPGRPGNWMPQERAEEMAQRRVERALEQQAQAFAVERQQMQEFFARQSEQAQQAIVQGLQQKAAAPAYTPDQVAQRQQARDVLHELEPAIKAVPELAREWASIREQLKQIEQTQTRLQQSHTTTYENSETSRLYQMAVQAGLPVSTPQQFQQLADMIKRIVRSNPEAHQAFSDGDLRVVPWALGVARQEIAAERQYARASIAQTKTATGKLPPRLGGGVPGATPPALPKWNPNDPGARERAMFKNARESVREHQAATG